jgi:elongation factor G
MSTHHVDDVRDIAIVGHRAAGKTSLADALLFEAHAVDRLGSVDDGTSVGDTDEDEQKHRFSIDTHVLHAEHAGKHMNLLDAPGYPDFIGAALEALVACETAAVVVSAVNGIEVNTRRMFHEAGARGLYRVLVINKVDADNVDFAKVYAGVRETFGKACALFNAPDGVGPKFTKVLDVIDPPKTVPSSCPVSLDEARTQLVEAVVDADEALMEKYLTDGTISTAELTDAIPKAIQAGTVVPVFCASAKKNAGVKELLDAFGRYGLSPTMARRKIDQLKVGEDGKQTTVEPNETAEFMGQVFKVVNDRYVGHLSFIRVITGKLTPNHSVVNRTSGNSIRIGQLLSVQGKTHSPVTEAVPGDIIAVAKVDGLHIGDTVSYKSDAPKLPFPRFPSPMYGLAVEPKNRGDEQKISAGLHKIADEDPTVRILHDPQTHELVISGVSQLHLEVVKERLKHRFDVEVVTKDPKIPYRETVTGKGEGDHRHKKQTGGRGQFAEVHLRVYSISRDIKSKEQLEAEFANKSNFEKLRSVHYDPHANFAFIDHVVGGTIPNNFLPAIEKGVKEAMERGVLAGYHVQDLAVEVYFGKDHPVDSSEAAFKTAGRWAFKKAFMAARPVLLEPFVKLEITVPTRFTGAILGDLPTKRAHVENQESLPGDLTVIMATAPLAEVARYAAQLGGMTQGQGSYTMELSHYDTVPANVQQQIVSKAQIKEEEED